MGGLPPGPLGAAGSGDREWTGDRLLAAAGGALGPDPGPDGAGHAAVALGAVGPGPPATVGLVAARPAAASGRGSGAGGRG